MLVAVSGPPMLQLSERYSVCERLQQQQQQPKVGRQREIKRPHAARLPQRKGDTATVACKLGYYFGLLERE